MPVGQIDLNIEAYDELLSKESLLHLYKEFLKATLSEREYGQSLYLALLARAASERIEELKRVMKDPGTVKGPYWETKQAVDTAFIAASNGAILGLKCKDMTNLQDVVSEVLGCGSDIVCRLIEGKIATILSSANPDWVGISIGYPSQLAYGLYVARVVKESSHARVVIGGATVSGIAKLGLIPAELGSIVDCVVAGDGFVPLRELILKGESLNALPSSMFGRGLKATCLHDAHPSHLPTPLFDDLPLHKYLTPGSMLPLYPSRGCYWGKCAFCTVKELNRTYAERSPVPLVEDMIELHAKHGSCHFYMSCDVISPSSMIALSQHLAQKAPFLKWQSEARFEKTLTPDRIRLIAEGGGELLKFGLESGSQPVLRQMRKGTDLRTITRVLESCRENGIRTAVYCLVGFPTETEQDLDLTVELLTRMKDVIDYVGFHQFVLNSGSDVSANPFSYGIEPIAVVDEVTSEMTYRRLGPGVWPRRHADDVKRTVGEHICTQIPVGPAPDRSCIHHRKRMQAAPEADAIVLKPIPGLEASVGDVMTVDGFTGDVTLQRKESTP